jgi:multidrug resistance efflux pump
MTPYTSQATVQGFIVRMAPEVVGRVMEVPVADNQRVKAGETLFRIDPRFLALVFLPKMLTQNHEHLRDSEELPPAA